MEVFEQEQQSSLDFITMLYKKRFVILGITLLGFLAGIVITNFIPPKFYSFGIIYPASDYNRETLLSNPQFGHELEADRLMQILESEKVRDTIIQFFDLETYYEVDKNNIDWSQKLDKQFIADVSFFRSKYLSIVISAKMKDPVLSANIVNKIIEIVNPVKRSIFEDNQQAEFDHIQKEYEEKQALLTVLEDSIYQIKPPNVSRNILYNHLLAVTANKVDASTLGYTDSPELEKLVREYIFQYGMFQDLKKSYEDAKYYINRPVPKTYIVDKAKPAYRKESPSMRVNASIGLMGGLLFALFLVIFQDRMKQIRALLKDA